MPPKFRSVLNAFKAVWNPYVELTTGFPLPTEDAAPLNDAVPYPSENRDAACDPYGVLFTRGVGEALAPATQYQPQAWQWTKNISTASITLTGNNKRYVPRRIIAIAGDAATPWSGNEIYLGMYYVPAAAGIPDFVWPVPIPPGYLDIDLTRFYEFPTSVVGTARPVTFAFSDQLSLYSAGPTGALFINYAEAK